MRAFEEIINKLDRFIRSYYRHRIIRGLIYTIGLLIITLLLLAVLEYFGHFGKTIRAVFFYGYVFVSAVIFYRYIILALLKWLHIGKTISHEQAAEIISNHFPEIKDRLINSLQLGRGLNAAEEETEFLKAAIEQKTKSIRHIQFTKAIDSKENTRKIPFALIPAFILMAVILLAPSVVKEPVKRISDYKTEYIRPYPFRLEVMNTPLQAIQGEDIEVMIAVYGEKLPAEVYLDIANERLKTIRNSSDRFYYRFRNLQNDLSFKLSGSGYVSETYQIKVFPKPLLINHEAFLKYPAYLNKSNETIKNVGDLTVPDGTIVSWLFETKQTDSIYITFSDGLSETIAGSGNGKFSYSRKIRENMNYIVKPRNKYVKDRDSIIHFVQVIPDLYPEISVEAIGDSLLSKDVFFSGTIRDDYGFSKLIFKYQVRNKDQVNKVSSVSEKNLPINLNVLNQVFFHNRNLEEIKLSPGERLEYWFEVWDNDQVNGNKAAKTGLFFIEFPDESTLDQMESEKRDDLKKEMDLLKKAMLEIKRESQRLQRSIIEKESIGWEESRKLQELLDKQLSLQQRMEALSKENTKLNELQRETKKYDEEIVRKQLELQQLFDKILSDEMKKMIEEIQKLLSELNKVKLQESLKKIEMSNDELSKSLDRTKELFKQLELEKLLNESAEKLKQLSEKQEKLADRVKESGIGEQELNEQKQIQSEFKQVQEKLEEARKKNDELEFKNDLMDTKKEEEDINSLLDQSDKELQKGNRGGASKTQKNTAKKMDELGKKIAEKLAEMQQEQLEEDIQSLRKLLDNLIEVSFNQEKLIEVTTKINRIDPEFNKLLDKQNKIRDDLRIIEDSLHALAKRQSSIEQFVLAEIAKINFNVEEGIKLLEERILSTAAAKQQYIMTSVNNLSLMLAEALDNMMNQMDMNSEGKEGSCPKPGGKGKGKPSLSKMRELQQQLNQQLQNMKEGMNRDKQGTKQAGGQSISEQFARMAAQQEALRRQLQGYLEELRNETGKGDATLSELLKDMEQTEKDLVNKRLTNETLARQKRIETRLLESEKAEQEREKEHRRQSNEAKDIFQSKNDSILEFYRKKVAEKELLKTVPVKFTPYYRNKANTYLISINP